MDGLTQQPTDTSQLAAYTCKHHTGKAGIMIVLTADLIDRASNAPTAQDAWRAVEDHGDLQNALTLHHTGQSFCSTKMQETDIFTYNIFAFQLMHTYTTERRRSANYQ